MNYRRTFILLLCAMLIGWQCTAFQKELDADSLLTGMGPLDSLVSSGDLHFEKLPTVWDEGIPLGNGMLGALIWEKDGKLRLSLDRADLWDLRPMENLQSPEWKFSWVRKQWENDTYELVQKKFDVPYDQSPAPSKIPGAALEFDVAALGHVEFIHLHLSKALCEIKWSSGARLLTFVHGEEPIGYYEFVGVPEPITYELIPPPYNLQGTGEADNPVTGQDLRRLGYPKGKLVIGEHGQTYEQEGWAGFRYQVHTKSSEEAGVLEGSWSISAHDPSRETMSSASTIEASSYQGLQEALVSHEAWWTHFWQQSSIHLPDPVLQKQWYLEQYKFGSAARQGAPPISLQAVWTADNGKLPPWKGDFHHDLNTQLSYWPAYSANHLEEEVGFLQWLWKNKETFKHYTHTYFESGGLNVPGVSTLTGEPMGGWIQYSFGPTVSAWLAHHFYLHWRYSRDRSFLEERAYPWLKDVSDYLTEISVVDHQGMHSLPISSSPEIHNNSRDAWFGDITNFDLALVRWTFEKTAELARELGRLDEAEEWLNKLSFWPDLAIDPDAGLLLTPHARYEKSHRHLSHLIGFHPLGLIDIAKGNSHQTIIENTLSTLDQVGSSEWVGYSFSWLGNAKARALDGAGAAEALRLFATSFCLSNSFHVNGDQSGKGHSNFTYRPFTLEGNFAFAAGIQEMLLQSHSGKICVFPAIPAAWRDVSFHQLRAEGAYLISAEMIDGDVQEILIQAEKGGEIILKNPFIKSSFYCSHAYSIKDNTIRLESNPGEVIHLSNTRGR